VSGELQAPATLLSWDKTTGTRYIGVWVDFIIGLDAVEK
jgi:hypothetical protein